MSMDPRQGDGHTPAGDPRDGRGPGAGKALVTGATGFIGQRLVRRLVDDGWQVTCLVRPGSRAEALRETGAMQVVCESLAASRADAAESVERALAAASPDVVFHLAGVVRALRPDEFAPMNEGAVETLARACAARAHPPVLVVVSSLAAAGPSAAGALREEADPARPVSIYGASKLAGEQAAARHALRLPVTIVRPPVVFGAGDTGMLAMLQPIMRWGLHVVPGRGEQRLSLVHVEDLVTGMLRAAIDGERLQPDRPGSGVYFLGAEDAPAFAELGRLLAAALGRPRVRIVSVPPSLLRAAGNCGEALARWRRRPSWINRDKVCEALAGSWVCSSGKARDQLGWKPAAPLAERLHETVEWYRKAGWLARR